ncbi:MAG: FkbM family methyltransferase [Betaproteobacteria bacterium]|nr:FkbM family methyltransferase [Betaproteobacteria bacterium]
MLAALDGVQPDVIKIDTEGAEYDILSSFPTEVLRKVSWIYGELHTEAIDSPSAFRVLDLLFPWFDIEVHKPLRKRNWFFDACNRSISDNFRGFRRSH